MWRSLYVNPILVPPAGINGCYAGYHRLFADKATGQVYLEYAAAGYMQLYKLVNGGGPLPMTE